MSDVTVKKKLLGMKKGELREHMYSLFESFESQISDLLYGYGFSQGHLKQYKMPAQHPNRMEYVKIIKKIPESHERGYQPFLVQHFWNPADSVAKKIGETITEPGDVTIAQKNALTLPYYDGNAPQMVMGNPAFPCNVPHIYLEKLAAHMHDFTGNRMQDLDHHMETLRNMIGADSGRVDASPHKKIISHRKRK